MKLQHLDSPSSIGQRGKSGLITPVGAFAKALRDRLMQAIKAFVSPPPLPVQSELTNIPVDTTDEDDETSGSSTTDNQSTEVAELELEQSVLEEEHENEHQPVNLQLLNIEDTNTKVQLEENLKVVTQPSVVLEPIPEIRQDLAPIQDLQVKSAVKVETNQQILTPTNIQTKLDTRADIPPVERRPEADLYLPPQPKIDPVELRQENLQQQENKMPERKLPLKMVAETTWVAKQDPVEGLYHYAAREVQRITNLKPEHPKFGGVVAAKLIHEVGRERAASTLAACCPKLNIERCMNEGNSILKMVSQRHKGFERER
jgi:hypothetical protein